MLRYPISRKRYRDERSSALVIVLFFVALLSIVVIAFLSRSTIALRASASSAGETKSKILASSAGDFIIGDLKQEIIAGSAANAGSAYWPVYVPNSNITMIPFMNGVPLAGSPATNAIPNLVSRSVSPANTSGADPYLPYPSAYYSASSVPPNRAASDPSAATPTLSTTAPYTTSTVNSSYPSLNGRYINPAQWNSHYLIPRLTSIDPPGSTNLDSTPITNFVTPDWVIVTRGGANSVSSTTPGFGTGGLSDSTSANTNCAIGRYAYAVYNEGGLLDMNAAGYPADPNTTTPSSPPFNTEGTNGLSSTQISQKGSLALADLTQLATGWTNLTQAQAQTQINNLVGWRNYATAQPSGTYGSFTFSSNNAASWLTNFALGNTNGFMQIAPAGVTASGTDQAFLSRQELISITQSLGMSPDFLQYMSTFTRALEQPSYAPDPNRPFILGTSLPALTNEASYIGNNDAVGNESSASPINVSFLTISTPSGANFTRYNGSTVVPGEPLVKYKFPLSYLTNVTYNYANTYANAAAAAIAADTVYQLFGIYRTSLSGPWIYDHGAFDSKGVYRILKLSEVAALNGSPNTTTAPREPDFAELLKAAILSGSLAKGGPNNGTGWADYSYIQDTSTDLNIIQIMANLIDQQDSDSYPTVISLNGYNVYGIEDLPYFYRIHTMSVTDASPATSPPVDSYNNTSQNSDYVTYSLPPWTTNGSSTNNLFTTVTVTNALDYSTTTPTPLTKSWTFTGNTNTTGCPTNYPATVYGIRKLTGSWTSAGAGEAALLSIPGLWNPHDQNTLISETNRPSAFRIYATTDFPNDPGTSGQYNIGTEWKVSGTFLNTNSGNGPLSSSAGNILKESIAGTAPSVYYSYPISSVRPLPAPTVWNSTTNNNVMYFSDNNGSLFREPTLVWNTNATGIVPTSPSGLPLGTAVKDINTGYVYFGIVVGKAPLQYLATFATTNQISPPVAAPQSFDGTYIVQPDNGTHLSYLPSNTVDQLTYYLQYLDPNNSQNWITYDVIWPNAPNIGNAELVVDTAKQYLNTYKNILKTGQIAGISTRIDPRGYRWGMAETGELGSLDPKTYGSESASNNVTYALEPTAYTNFNDTTGLLKQFSVIETSRPRADKGDLDRYLTPASSVTAGNPGAHWFSGLVYYADSGVVAHYPSPLYFPGLFSQNSPAILFNSRGGTPPTPNQQNYYEDPDGVARPAMGAYADTSLNETTNTSLAQSPTNDAYRIGMPEATASTFDNHAVSTATAQTQSRPIILNRPFRSVSEMSCAFTGTPWKNIDFFHPASGDSALLDTFCIYPPPANAMVAAKVDLNTRQAPVIQAIVAGAYRDEWNNATNSPPSYSLPPLSGSEANAVATNLVGITTDTSLIHAGRGPLQNISGLVGRFAASPGSSINGLKDFYTYSNQASSTYTPNTATSFTFEGLTGLLGTNVYTNPTNFASNSAPFIQRFREAGIRPLVDVGQVRVWNLLIDVVAQSGFYPKTATGLDQFFVNGQTRLWVHVAIDRYTGQVIDKQVEVVTP